MSHCLWIKPHIHLFLNENISYWTFWTFHATFGSVNIPTHLKLLGEGVGGVQFHDVLHKLLHRQRLMTVWSQKQTFISALNVIMIIKSPPSARECVCDTCSQQHGGRWSRYDFRWCAFICIKISRLETVSVTQRNWNISAMFREHCFRVYVCGCFMCVCAPPVDEYAHQHQQTEDGESGDDSQRNDGPLLPLDTSDQPDARLVAAVSALWWSVRDAQKQKRQSAQRKSAE